MLCLEGAGISQDHRTDVFGQSHAADVPRTQMQQSDVLGIQSQSYNSRFWNRLRLARLCETTGQRYQIEKKPTYVHRIVLLLMACSPFALAAVVHICLGSGRHTSQLPDCDRKARAAQVRLRLPDRPPRPISGLPEICG